MKIFRHVIPSAPLLQVIVEALPLCLSASLLFMTDLAPLLAHMRGSWGYLVLCSLELFDLTQ